MEILELSFLLDSRMVSITEVESKTAVLKTSIRNIALLDKANLSHWSATTFRHSRIILMVYNGIIVKIIIIPQGHQRITSIFAMISSNSTS